MARMELESKRMTQWFNVLVAHTLVALEKGEVVTVNHLKLLVPDSHSKKKNKLVKKLNGLEKNDLAEAFNLMSEFWSFFDHDLLSTIIESYGDNKLCGELDHYLDQFKEYCERRLLEVPNDAFNNGTCKQFKVKLDDIFTVPIKKLRELKIKLSLILDTTIHLVGFKRGCIELSYVSMHELNTVFPLNTEQMHKLSWTNILKIYVDSESIFYEKIDNIDAEGTLTDTVKVYKEKRPELEAIPIGAGEKNYNSRL